MENEGQMGCTNLEDANTIIIILKYLTYSWVEKNSLWNSKVEVNKMQIITKIADKT